MIRPDYPNGIVKTGEQADFIHSVNLTFTKQCLSKHFMLTI